MMSSNQNLESLVTDFIHCLMDMSKKCEEARFTLNSCPDFDPFTLFRRLDVEQNKYLDESNFVEFLRINKITSSIEENKYVILFYDSNSSRNLNYNEFLNVVLCKSYYEMNRLEESNQGYLSYETEKAFVDVLSAEINLIRNIGQILNEIKSTGQFSIQMIYQMMNSKSFLTNNHFKAFFQSKGINASDEDIQTLTKRLDIRRNGKVSVTDIEKIAYFPYSKEPSMNKANYENESSNRPKERRSTPEEEVTFNKDNIEPSSLIESQHKKEKYEEEDNRRNNNVVYQYKENENEVKENHPSSSSLYQINKGKYDRTADTFANTYDKTYQYQLPKGNYSSNVKKSLIEYKRYSPPTYEEPEEYIPDQRSSNNNNYSRYAYQPNKRRDNEESYQHPKDIICSRPLENSNERQYERPLQQQNYQINNSKKQYDDERPQQQQKQYRRPIKVANEEEQYNYQLVRQYKPQPEQRQEKTQYYDDYEPQQRNQPYKYQSKERQYEKVNQYSNKNTKPHSPIKVSDTLSLRLSPERKYVNNDDNQDEDQNNNQQQSYRNQRDKEPNMFKEDQVILFFRTIMESEAQIEKTKVDLSSQQDFNVDDTYSLFERENQDLLNELDIKYGFNLFLLYPTKEELKLLLAKYDLMKQGGINYSDFFDMVTPFDKEIRDMIEDRIPKGLPQSDNKTEMYSPATKTNLITLFRLLISSENRIESLRKRFADKKDLTLKNVFTQMKQANNDFITVYDLEKYLKANGVVFSQKEVDLLFIRLDRNRDGRISYDELSNEFTSAMQC